jgi:MFS family permease
LVRSELSATEIGIIFSVGTVIGLLLEVPSGAIADRIGRKTSMIIANAGWALSMFIFWRVGSFMGFLIANALYWAAGSLWTGTHDAFIYETLQELGREKEIKKISGRALLISQVTTGILFVVVPVIAKFSLSLPFLLNTIVFAFSSLLTLTIIEPERSKSVAEEEIGKDFLGFKTFFTNRVLLATGLVFGFIGGINGILEDFRQVYLDFIHLDIAYFGFIYLGLRLLTGFLGVNVDRIEKALGRRTTFLLIPLSSLITYIGLYLINSFYGLIFIAMDGMQEGLSRPLEQEYLNKAISNSKRATLLSVFNLITNLVRAGAVFIGGITIDYGGINSGFLLAAILLIVFVSPLVVWFLRQPVQ